MSGAMAPHHGWCSLSDPFAFLSMGRKEKVPSLSIGSGANLWSPMSDHRSSCVASHHSRTPQLCTAYTSPPHHPSMVGQKNTLAR